MPKLFIATPMFGGVCTGAYTSSLLQLTKRAAERGVEMTHTFIINDSLVPRARNCLAHMFMNSDSTHLLFIDADIVFDADEVLDMLDVNQEVVCGLYPKKHIDWNRVKEVCKQNVSSQFIPSAINNYVVQTLNDSVVMVGNPRREIIEVARAGTGMMLISRSALEKLSASTPRRKLGINFNDALTCDTLVYTFFEIGSDSENVLLSEDYYFCDSWRAAGGRVFAAPWVTLQHIGTYVFG